MIKCDEMMIYCASWTFNKNICPFLVDFLITRVQTSSNKFRQGSSEKEVFWRIFFAKFSLFPAGRWALCSTFKFSGKLFFLKNKIFYKEQLLSTFKMSMKSKIFLLKKIGIILLSIGLNHVDQAQEIRCDAVKPNYVS